MPHRRMSEKMRSAERASRFDSEFKADPRSTRRDVPRPKTKKGTLPKKRAAKSLSGEEKLKMKTCRELDLAFAIVEAVRA
jgi:hypothetical protein